jgi:ABC-2 type transport system permease protein
VSAPATYVWFAGHEVRLAWREFFAMLTAGRRARMGTLVAGIALFVVFMHGLAWLAVRSFTDAGQNPSKTTLVIVSGVGLLAFSLMVSQAMESVTRAFYSRSDLDLILSSPVNARRVFAVRIAILAVTVTLMGLLLVGPFVNVLTLAAGPHWLAGYGVILSLGAVATAFAVALTVALFRVIGPRRTRFVAQVVAAVVGAAFVIGIQVAAIMSYGTLSQLAFLASDTFIDSAPAANSLAYWPARAILGDLSALIPVAAVGAALLALTIATFSGRFGEHAIAAAGAGHGATSRARARAFRAGSAAAVLRRKEWTLLRRDPWLMSQTLMQILYLLPPALMLWKSFGDGAGALLILVPILVMAGGQLAGGLAWLAISGEDAPELVATAPVSRRAVIRAKIEAVLSALALVFAPLLLGLALVAPTQAAITAAFLAVAAIAATTIQLWFRVQAKRSTFRRRHTASRIATFAEAFSSIGWAGTAALAASGMWQAAVTAVLTLGVLGVTRLISPHRARRTT